MKTRVKLNLNFTRSHAVTYTNQSVTVMKKSSVYFFYQSNYQTSFLLKSDIGIIKAGESQYRVPGQASGYELRVPNPLDSSTNNQMFYQDFGAP